MSFSIGILWQQKTLILEDNLSYQFCHGKFFITNTSVFLYLFACEKVYFFFLLSFSSFMFGQGLHPCPQRRGRGSTPALTSGGPSGGGRLTASYGITCIVHGGTSMLFLLLELIREDFIKGSRLNSHFVKQPDIFLLSHRIRWSFGELLGFLLKFLHNHLNSLFQLRVTT